MVCIRLMKAKMQKDPRTHVSTSHFYPLLTTTHTFTARFFTHTSWTLFSHRN